MNKTFKLFLLSLLFVLVFAMTACGSGTQEGNNSAVDNTIENSEEPQEQTKLSIEEWNEVLLNAVKAEKENYNTCTYDLTEYDLTDITEVAEAEDENAQSLLGDITFFSEWSREAGMAARYNWYSRAAAQGDAWSQFMIGWTSEGLPSENEDEVIAYLQRAADQGLICACSELGQVYYNGEIDSMKPIEKNYIKAREYMEKAVSGNHLYDQEYRQLFDQDAVATAHLFLGYIYQKGLGVEQNEARAKDYFSLAAQGGNKTAADELDQE